MLTESKRQALIERVRFVVQKETCNLPFEQAKLYLSQMLEIAFKEYNRLTDKEWAQLNEAEKMLCN